MSPKPNPVQRTWRMCPDRNPLLFLGHWFLLSHQGLLSLLLPCFSHLILRTGICFDCRTSRHLWPLHSGWTLHPQICFTPFKGGWVSSIRKGGGKEEREEGVEKRGREGRGRKRRLLKGGGDKILALVWSTPLNVQLSQESAPMSGISHLCEYTGQICAFGSAKDCQNQQQRLFLAGFVRRDVWCHLL